MKKTMMALTVTGLLLVGGTVGASVTTISNTTEGLKIGFTEKAEPFKEDFKLYDMREYEETKLGQLESESDKYFEQKKAEYKTGEKAKVDAEYETAKADVFAHIDKIFGK